MNRGQHISEAYIRSMGGPGSGRKRKPARAAPKGARWLETRRKVSARYGDICHICGHPGAGDIDHVVPVPDGDVAGYYNLDNLRPAHGTRSPCVICKVACNQVKGRSAPGGRKTAAQRLLAAAKASGNGAQANGSGHAAPPADPEPRQLTESEVEARMTALEPHWPGCGCRQKILSGGIASRCW